MNSRLLLRVPFLVVAMISVGPMSRGSAAPSEAPVSLRPGAIELGLGSALVDYDGSLSLMLEARAGSFAGAGSSLLGFELDTSWTHVAELDELRIFGAATWQHPLGPRSVWGFVGVLGGWSQEWLGSFHQARFPLGATAGIRFLPQPPVALRLDYRWLRLLDDPVQDPTEQQVLIGISWLLRNQPMVHSK